MTSIGQRKADHLALCATDEVAFRDKTTLLDQVRFVHDALPDLDTSAIDPSTTILGKKLRAPIVIAAMTGGTEEAARTNLALPISPVLTREQADEVVAAIGALAPALQ